MTDRTYYFKELTLFDEDVEYAAIRVDLTCFENESEAMEHALDMVRQEPRLDVPIRVPKEVVEKE